VTVYYTDDAVTLHEGDCLDVLPTLADASVDCIVTSPPYFLLRDYGHAGQHGLEESPAQYVETMRAVFAHCWRVLADDGTLWLNLGDSYARQGGAGRGGGSLLQGRKHGAAQETSSLRRRKPGVTLPDKNLLGIPWRVAFALQGDGWILRNAIVWHKPNSMPESVKDRLTTTHEHVFLLTKSPRYSFNLDAIREPHAEVSLQRSRPHRADPGRSAREGRPYGGIGAQTLSVTQMTHPQGRNPGDVWTIPTQPFPEAHYAVMAPALARRCLLAGCKPGGTVLDPYHGAGTTGMVAGQLGMRYVGIELNPDNLDLSLRTRMAQSALVDGGEAS
jgi:DNA modification methylase